MSISKTKRSAENAHHILEDVMRGQVISQEYQNMEWVRDADGKEYVCYSSNVKDKDHLSNDEKAHCLDSSLTLGDNW